MRKVRRLRNEAAHLRNISFQDIEDLLDILNAIRRDQLDFLIVPRPYGRPRNWNRRVDRDNAHHLQRWLVETARYTGPTKAGGRFPWDKFKQFTQFVEVLVQQLGVAVSSEAALFPEMQPKRVTDVKQTVGAAETILMIILLRIKLALQL